MHRIPLVLTFLAALLLCGAAPAPADDGGLSIGHVEPGKDGTIKVLVSVPSGATVSPDDLTVSIGSTALKTTAKPAGSAGEEIRRTTVIAFDTSRSMNQQGRIEAARAAASTFLKTVPDDVYVGIVTFDATVETALAPSRDRAAAQKVVDNLKLATRTRLNDGVIEAVKQAGTEGQRRLLVLSDGKDTSKTPESDVTAAIRDAGLNVDVVVLDQSGESLKPLKAMSDAGEGTVISADAESLNAAFSQEAAALARQVLVTATLPEGDSREEATVSVTASIDGTTQKASTYTVIREPGTWTSPLDASIDEPIRISRAVMLGGLVAIGLGLLLLFSGLLVSPRPVAATAEDRISAYAAGGAGPTAQAMSSHRSDNGPALHQAKDAAAKMLHRNRGLEQKISQRLEAAGSAFKPSEWLLLHGALVLLGGLAGLVFGGNLIVMVLGLVAGYLLPRLWLRRKQRRRIKAFNRGLADTLQLMSGSLSAGLSLAQSVDTVVREGTEPIAGEFKRVLIETRLGVTLEEAMDGVAARMSSKDFEWVVMAIRIQREVGGNLSELLNNVAATLRERDYLRRQVATMSAEGKLSGYILGGLPPGMLLYMLAVRRDYVMPLFTEPMGWAMLAIAAMLLGTGAFLMSRMVKVEV
ncbi:MAG: type II secretion system F family protein [Nocardioides sp.]